MLAPSSSCASRARLTDCLSAFLPSFLPSCLPACLPALADIDDTQKALLEALSDMAASPKSKYKEAQTSAQDYGWVSDPLVPRSSQFHYGMKGSEVTSYANAYIESLGVSPFSNKGGKV